MAVVVQNEWLHREQGAGSGGQSCRTCLTDWIEPVQTACENAGLVEAWAAGVLVVRRCLDMCAAGRGAGRHAIAVQASFACVHTHTDHSFCLGVCAGAREVVLLDREHLALQCGLASASATLRGGAKVEGLQVGSPLSGSSSSSSSSSADSSGSLTGSIADGDEIGGQPPKPDQEVDKAAARHNHWAHLPLPSFWFHGPDLQRAIPNAANLAAVNEEHAGQAGSHGLAHPSGADDLGVCEEQRQGHQTGGAVDGNGQCRSNGVKRAGRAADHDSVGSDGNSSSDSEAQDGGSSSSSSCGYTSRNGSSGSGSSSSSLGRDVNIAGLSGSGQKSQTPHVWSFPLDWSDHEQVELLAQRCNSSSSSSSFGGSRGGGNAVSGSSRVSSGRGAGIFEGNSSRGRRSSTAPPFDVVLACDVLYEARAVQPIARIIPK
eukprot:1157316-Pelagomonas_calceolata.AAC.3